MLTDVEETAVKRRSFGSVGFHSERTQGAREGHDHRQRNAGFVAWHPTLTPDKMFLQIFIV